MPSPEAREIAVAPAAPSADVDWLHRLLLGASVGGIAAVAHALLEVRHDGWLAPRLVGVAMGALPRHLSGGAAAGRVAALAGIALLLAAVVRFAPPAYRRALDRAGMVLLAFAAFVAATGHFFAPTAATPRLRGGAGLLGNAGLLLALYVATLLLRAAFLGGGRRRFGLREVLALVVAVTPILLGWFARDTPEAIVPMDPARTSIALISVDTLRADRVGCYGSGRDATPSIDAFARDAVRFAQAATPFPFTLTAHATLLSGLDPAAHGAIPIGPRVDERLPPFADVPMVAQAFRDAGWLTVAVVDDCLWMQPQYRLGRGFDLWRVVSGDLPDKVRELRELLQDLGGRPCLLFLHCFDVHSDYRQLPYECAPQDRGVYSGWYRGPFHGASAADPSVKASDLLREWNRSGEAVPEDVVRYVSDLYDEGVRTADRTLGEAFELLDRAGFRDHAVLVTADHGEEFREHGRFMHDAQLFEESVRVPLLLRLPRAQHAGRVVETPVSLLDVAPTIAELAKVPLEPVQGRSLLPLLGADEGDDAPLFFGAQAGESAVRLGRFKLLRRGEKVELYDLGADPGERTDVAAGRPDVVRALSSLLDQRLETDRALARQHSRGADVTISESDRRRMEAIGYQ